MRRLWLFAAALTTFGSMSTAYAQSTAGLQVTQSGNVGIGTTTPTQALDVRGNMFLAGILIGQSPIGGNAGVIQGYGTGGSQAGFSFKYDSANFGNTPTAIQIWNSSTGVFKTFIINHPSDPNRYLVHATVEGPEAGVFYRGTAHLHNGRADVMLPDYFEALTRPEDRTVLLTNIGGFDRLAIEKQARGPIVDGRFVVISDNPNSTQEFHWEVKAVRKDAPRLVVAPLKDDISVAGIGPYTYSVAR
jgi:hypothetical protein